jgi:molecular chaperone GrpE
MSGNSNDNTIPTPESATSAPPQPATADGGAPTAAAGAPEGQSVAADARIAALESQVADLTDRLLRAHAEMDNMRKRAERERADIAKYAISKFASDVLTVGDNFVRAVSAVPPDAAEKDPVLRSLVEGVTMIEREFLNVLERNGVKRIDPTGQPFNPHLHQAVMEQENPDVPSGTVLQVFQAGYTIEDRVLRPAMVAVSKGGPKPAEKPPAGAELPAAANAGQEPSSNGKPPRD